MSACDARQRRKKRQIEALTQRVLDKASAQEERYHYPLITLGRLGRWVGLRLREQPQREERKR